MRAMTGSEVLVADKLFATLDTTIRPLYPETRPKVLCPIRWDSSKAPA